MGKAYASKDLTKLLKYNCLDTVATARAYARMVAEPEWNTPRVQRLYGVHEQLARIAGDMHDAGFLVDKTERARLASLLLDMYHEREKKFLDLVGIPGMRCTPNDMRALIYRRHENGRVKMFSLPDPHIPELWVEKKFQTLSTDQSALLILLIQPFCPDGLKPIIEAYWQAEGAWKARATYVVSESIEHAIGDDGRLRAEWNSCGTDTGRWACRRPNLMNLSEKKDEDGGALQGDLPSMRAMYRAAPGHVLVHADYSQLELRVMAAVSGDSVLSAALASGDVYTEDAKDLFRLPAHYTKCKCDKREGPCKYPDKHVKDAIRKQAKIIHLLFQYAGGEAAIFKAGLEQDRSLTFRTVQLIRQGLLNRYAQTVAYWDAEHARVMETGYSESRILQRRRTYPREPPPTETANYPIQSTASDIANLAMIELDKKLKKHVPGAQILIQLHDAFDVECREGDKRIVNDIMQEVMEKPFIIEGKKFTFPVEIKTGEKWSEV